MLFFYFPRLKENKVLAKISELLYSDYYLALVAFFMAASNVFGLELPVYYIFLLFLALTVALAPDMLPVLPLVCCGYMTFSAKNNPAVHVETSLFRQPVGYVQLTVIGSLIAVLLIVRLVFELLHRRENRKLPALTYGFAALGVAYLLGGAFSGFYSGDTVLFGLVQILALSFFYFYFFFTVDWKKIGKGYFARLFAAIGCGMVLEIVGLYTNPGVFSEDGSVNRGALVTGWGMYNNVGCVMAMCLPAPFYLAIKEKNGWIFNLLGNVFLLALVLTQSRNSILFGALIYAACFVLVLLRTKGRSRLYNLIVYGAMALAAVICIIVFLDEFKEIFFSIIKVGFDDNGRWEIYVDGFKQFFAAPVFGNGFYECGAFQWGNLGEGSFLPPRYHNTYVQLLASCGAVGLIAYLFHRVQTVLLFFKKPSLEKIFIGLCLLAMILTSLFDCHFFNFGPGLIYSCLLILAEKGTQSETKAEETSEEEQTVTE